MGRGMKPLAAVIVESRKFDNFGEVCKSHLDKLPNDTDLFVFTSSDLIEEYKYQLSSLEISAKFNLYNVDMQIPSNFRSIDGFDTLLKSNEKLPLLLHYCLFMTRPEFWDTFIGYERILTFQMDTLIFRHGIEEFMEWDYVGAPCYNFYNNQTIQNGGLSLRNPRIMEYICRYHSWNDDISDMIQLGKYSTANFFAEDIFFTLRMIKYGIGNYAPMDVAKQFSVESKLEWRTFGGHRIDVYHSNEIVEKLKGQYN
jgi:hypothetical protein